MNNELELYIMSIKMYVYILLLYSSQDEVLKAPPVSVYTMCGRHMKSTLGLMDKALH